MNTPEIVFLIISLEVMSVLFSHGQGTGRIHPFGQNLRRRKIDKPTRSTVWQEWPNDGSPPIRHSSDPGEIQGSFIVKMNFMDFKTSVK